MADEPNDYRCIAIDVAIGLMGERLKETRAKEDALNDEIERLNGERQSYRFKGDELAVQVRDLREIRRQLEEAPKKDG